MALEDARRQGSVAPPDSLARKWFNSVRDSVVFACKMNNETSEQKDLEQWVREWQTTRGIYVI